MCVLELMNGHTLQILQEQLKVPGSILEGNELLTSEFLRFRSRLNETSGGLGKIGAVSGSDCRILKFLRAAFLAAKLFKCFADIGITFTIPPQTPPPPSPPPLFRGAYTRRVIRIFY